MAKYVDGFVLVVPKNKTAQYKKMASDASKSWMKHGALSYFECIGDDLNPKVQEGFKPRKFAEMAKAKSGEVVWFSFIVYKSKKHRDSVNKKVMKEFNELYKDKKDMSMPFDVSKMAYGGFEVAVEGGA